MAYDGWLTTNLLRFFNRPIASLLLSTGLLHVVLLTSCNKKSANIKSDSNKLDASVDKLHAANC